MAELNNNFILVMDWMIEELKLTGNEVILYALIHSFSQGEKWFTGSLTYLSKRTGLSRQSVISLLGSLVEKGFLLRREVPHKGIKYVDYKTKWSRNLTSQESLLVKNLTKTSQESLPEVVKNLDPIINNNKYKINNARARAKKGYLDFPQRTDTDFDYIEEMLQHSIPKPDDKDPAIG